MYVSRKCERKVRGNKKGELSDGVNQLEVPYTPK